MHEGMSVLQDERARVKEQQDGAYHRMQALKQQSKGKKDAYYQNRRFSQEVLHSWLARLTLLHNRAGVHTCIPSKRRRLIYKRCIWCNMSSSSCSSSTSLAFVSVPLEPLSCGASVPWL